MSDVDHSVELDVLAATLLVEGRESGDVLEHLATKLGGGFPAWTKIERAGWFLSSSRPVRLLTVDLGDARYRIERTPQGPVARRVRVVRGIEIGSEELGTDAWLAALFEAFAATAARNEAALRAMERFVRGV